MAESELEVEETEIAPEDEQEPILKYELINYPADITLGGYVEHFDRGELKIPAYNLPYQVYQGNLR